MNLVDHLKVKEQDRNFDWDEIFFKLFSDSQVFLITENPVQGPDSWPYLMCETEKIQSNLAAPEPVQKIFHWAATRGIGLVVNPHKEPYADYVFSYGMIWSFKETGYFLRPDLAVAAGKVDYTGQKIIGGEPSPQYLPHYVRNILKDFLKDQMIFNPKILMLTVDQKNYDLAFSLESLGNPPEAEHAGIAEAISWFLPPHYSVVLISEAGLPAFIAI